MKCRVHDSRLSSINEDETTWTVSLFIGTLRLCSGESQRLGFHRATARDRLNTTMREPITVLRIRTARRASGCEYSRTSHLESKPKELRIENRIWLRVRDSSEDGR